MKRWMIVLLAVLALIMMFSGCGSLAERGANHLSNTPSKKADPEAAMLEIYEDIDIQDVELLLIEDIEETLGITRESLEDYCMVTTSGRFGLADVIILKPVESKREDIRQALLLYREKRITEFEKYDIKDSTRISREAVIYGQGDYLILLMLDDNAAAEKIIDKYIPR